MSMWIGWMTERLKVSASKTGDREKAWASSKLAPAAATNCKIDPKDHDDREVAGKQRRVGELV